MVKKKVDARVKGLIELSVKTNNRSLFILVGDHGKDQVENLHKVLAQTRVKARPSVLWCYKKELGFSTHRKKRMKEIKRNQSRGLHDPDRDDPFDLFISSTSIRWAYYKETDQILGQTFGMCVLQDFEGVTPNLLARTIETVEGGGIVILLMKTVKSLKQLYTMSMDVHSRFRTEAHHEVIPRFNERFILSLADCQSCLVLDDELNILPISSKINAIPAASEGGVGLNAGETDASGVMVDPELEELKASLTETPHVGCLVNLAKTIDQAHAIMSFLDAISEKTLRSTVALTAARGRGKSASIGICLAGAIAYGYSNIFVTAPSPENLKSVFEFLIIGLKALKYVEHMDFETLQEHRGDAGKVVIRLNIFKNHRQTVQYILPDDHSKLAQAELIAIDEAAAIPLPVVKKLLGPYLVFMSSTVNGYEGTGRALSLKLIQQLRKQQGQAMANAAQSAGNAVAGAKGKKGSRKVHEDRWKTAAEAAANFTTSGASSGARTLTEITLETPIRYGKNDKVEKWLNNLLCLDVIQNSSKIVSGIPSPRDCELYLVNRDALFSYHAMAEGLLQRIWALYTSAHYKNTPNDLQMLSDAPAHRLFVLLGPRKNNASSTALPDVLCVIQVAFEGRISQKSIHSQMSRGNKASGDMIPWVVSQQFNDNEFATLSGARIVRVATHPDVQKMGYGSKAIELLISHFQGDFNTEVLDVGVYGNEGSVESGDAKDDSEDEGLQNEEITQKATLPPLLVPVSELPTEQLNWLGVSYGLTPELLNFWSRQMFKMCYIRQSTNDLTGEHSVIMLRQLQVIGGQKSTTVQLDDSWLQGYVHDYRRRIISLLSYNFSSLPSSVAITLIDPDKALTSAHQSASVDEEKVSDVSRDSTSRAYNSPMLTASELVSVHLSHHDLKRLELYSRNMVDHHMIIDTLPTLSTLFFQGRFPSSCRLSHLQVAILLSIGLQRKSVDDIAVEVNLPVNQVLAFFNKTVRKLSLALTTLLEKDEESKMKTSSKVVSQMENRALAMSATSQTLQDEQNNDVKDFNLKQKRELLMQNKDIAKHALKGVADGELETALAKSMKQGYAIPSSISVLKTQDAEEVSTPSEDKKKKRKKDKGSHEKKHKKSRADK